MKFYVQGRQNTKENENEKLMYSIYYAQGNNTRKNECAIAKQAHDMHCTALYAMLGKKGKRHSQGEENTIRCPVQIDPIQVTHALHVQTPWTMAMRC